MKNLQFPIKITFKISTLANDFIVKDANESIIAYVRQKLFKFVEEVIVFSDESKTNQLYTIKANKWLDFNTSYFFTKADGSKVGMVGRKGWASIWKARYEIYDENNAQDLLIREDNAWVKVGDALLKEIPVVNLFSGLMLNPSYSITRPDGTVVVRFKKDSSFFGRKFTVTKLNEFESGEEERIVLSLMMLILLERRRG